MINTIMTIVVHFLSFRIKRDIMMAVHVAVNFQSRLVKMKIIMAIVVSEE
jgi:hypothetical protein